MKQNSNNWRNSKTSELSDTSDTADTADDADNFYQDLDRKTSHQSCCTCQTLVFLFAGFAILISGFIFYFYWQITHGGLFQLPNNQIASISELNNKLQKPVVNNDQVILTLTDNELNAVLNEGLSINDFVLKDIVLTINPKEILIYGNLIKPLSSKVVLTCVPVVENDKIKLKISNITAGKINLPVYFDQKVADSLNAILDQKMAVFYNQYITEEVGLGQNTIIIKGRKR